MKVYEELGLTKDQYIYRIRKGLIARKNYTGRFSGLNYRNSPERLNEIKEKYRNGVTADILKEIFLK